MPKAKVIKKIPKEYSGVSESVSSILQSIMSIDPDSPDTTCIAIIIEKIKTIRVIFEKFLSTLLRLMLDTFGQNMLNSDVNEVTKKLTSVCSWLRKFDFTPYDMCISHEMLSPILIKRIKKFYLRMKESSAIRDILQILKNIAAINKYSYEGFVEKSCAMEIELKIFYKVGRLDYNLCSIYDDSTYSKKFNSEQKKTIYGYVVELRELGILLRSVLSKPDFNIEFLFPRILSLVEGFSKDIPGCESAFELIKNSSHIFEANCTKYFKKACSGDPSALFVDFVGDVLEEQTKTISENGPEKTVKELSSVLRHIRRKISKVMAAKGAKIPDNIKSLIEATDTFITEYDLKASGDNYSIAEVQELQQKFAGMFL
jgi:hypothetical protein